MRPTTDAHAIAIRLEVLKGLVAGDGEVHLNAPRHLHKVFVGNVILRGGMCQRLENRTVGITGSRRLQQPVYALYPSCFFVDGQVIVGEIVAEAAIRVGGVHGAAASAGQGDKRIVEIACRLARYPSAVLVCLKGVASDTIASSAPQICLVSFIPSHVFASSHVLRALVTVGRLESTS